MNVIDRFQNIINYQKRFQNIINKYVNYIL